jgi:hypothetical protein
MAARYFYLLEPLHQWGDYGDTLTHGHFHFNEEDGTYHLSRTGPFIPPITQPFDGIVVTDAFRQELMKSELSGFEFMPVVKDKIVEIPWHEWDADLPDPPEFPESGEPEDYIDAGIHSERTSASIGDLWALQVPKIARVERDRGTVESKAELHLVLATTKGMDFVRSPDVGYFFVSECAKKWLKSHCDKWVEFEEASIR